MRTLALALSLLTLAPAAAAQTDPAQTDPAQEARSATAACLSAVIDNAPVEDIDGDDVTIRRGKAPVSCTVRVTGGEPAPRIFGGARKISSSSSAATRIARSSRYAAALLDSVCGSIEARHRFSKLRQYASISY